MNIAQDKITKIKENLRTRAQLYKIVLEIYAENPQVIVSELRHLYYKIVHGYLGVL